MNDHRTRRAFLSAAPVAAMLLALFATTAPAAQVFVDPMFGVDVTTNVQYGTGVDGNGNNVNLLLDVYQPTGANVPTDRPAIVLMHGGFFINGDKLGMTGLATEFTMRGYTAVSINYRKLGLLPPPPGTPITPVASRFPGYLIPMLTDLGYTIDQYVDTIAAAVGDQATAVNWLAANAAAYGVNSDWIAAGGYSAGAVSSLLLGAGVVDGAVADVGAVFSIAGGMFGLEPFIDASDPGVFILHGDLDTTVPFSEVGFLQSALTSAAVPSESLILNGEDHSISPLLDALFADPDPFFEFMATQLGVPVPEPSTFALAAMSALVLLVGLRRRRR